MAVQTTLMVLILALLAEALFGYPDGLYRRIGHPVTWMGAGIAFFDAKFNRTDWNPQVRRATGVLTLAVLIAVPVGVTVLVQQSLSGSWLGAIGLAVIASTLIASRSLYDHVHEVAVALETQGLAGGQQAVAKIVGRDPLSLDEPSVARAAIESLAENASDGVVAPVFWFAVLGLPGIVAYKVINTADSMIGHRTQRHEAFGWAAARLDDLVNLPASRFTGVLFALAAALMPGASPRAALTAMGRDAAKHRSPNAGWPESAMAGALDLKLAGPRTYDGVLVGDAYMGDGRREATANDIRRAVKLAAVAWVLMLAIIAACWLIAPG